MLTQPIRIVATTLAILAWTGVQCTSGLEAQETSSRRPRLKKVGAPLTIATTANSVELDGRTAPVSDNSQTSRLVQRNELNDPTQKKFPHRSSRRKPDETPTRIALESPSVQLQVDRTTPMQPTVSILPVAFIADQVPVPSLEDPEMFRVPSTDSVTQFEPSFQPLAEIQSQAEYVNPPGPSDQFPQPNGSYSSLPVRGQTSAYPVAAGAGTFALPSQQSENYTIQEESSLPENPPVLSENSLLDQLPISNLHQGIAIDAMSQANAKDTVGDPYLASRVYGGEQRVGAGSIVKTWRSPNMRHRPLYFEQPNLERYGHTHPRLQPLISGAHFFSSVALLPYKTGVTPASKCQYSIGYDRPGDCVPKVREHHPLNPRAALRQAAVVVGGVAAL